MTRLDLQFVGTGNAFAPGGLCWNGFVVNGKYLFEAPPQALQVLNKFGVDTMTDLDGVVISHHHGDHFLGLPSLLLQWKFGRRTRPVRIIGPTGTQALATSIATSVYPGIMETAYEIEWDERLPGESFRLGELELEALGMRHDERLSGSLGFKAALGTRRFAYTGDSAMCDSVLDLARHGEVLVSECASRDEQIAVHMNLRDDIPNVRAAMKADATLLLTHLGPGVDANGFARTKVAQDFKTYRF